MRLTLILPLFTAAVLPLSAFTVDFEVGYQTNRTVADQPVGGASIWHGAGDFLQVNATAGRAGGTGLESPGTLPGPYRSQRFVPAASDHGGSLAATGKWRVGLDLRLDQPVANAATGTAIILRFASSHENGVGRTAARFNIKDSGQLATFEGDREVNTAVWFATGEWKRLVAEIDFDRRSFSYAVDNVLVARDLLLHQTGSANFGVLELLAGADAQVYRAFSVDNIVIERTAVATPASGVKSAPAKPSATPATTTPQAAAPSASSLLERGYIADTSVAGQPRGGAAEWRGPGDFLVVRAGTGPTGGNALQAPAAFPGPFRTQHYTPSAVEVGGDRSARGTLAVGLALRLEQIPAPSISNNAFIIRLGHDTDGEAKGCAVRFNVKDTGAVHFFDGERETYSGLTLVPDVWTPLRALINYDAGTVTYAFADRPAQTARFHQSGGDELGRIDISTAGAADAYRRFSVAALTLARDEKSLASAPDPLAPLRDRNLAPPLLAANWNLAPAAQGFFLP